MPEEPSISIQHICSFSLDISVIDLRPQRRSRGEIEKNVRKQTGGGEEAREAHDQRNPRLARRPARRWSTCRCPTTRRAQWAEMAGVDVAVVGDSLAMIAHGHPQHDPRHHGHDGDARAGRAPRRARTPSCSAACPTRATTRSTARSPTPRASCRRPAATRSSRRAASRRRISCKALVDAGIPTASHIGLTPHTIAMFGGFKIQGRTADAAMKILEDALAIEDAGCFMLEFEAVPAKIAKLISEQLDDPDHRHRRRRRHRRADPALPRPARRVHRLQAEVHQALRQADRGRRRRHQANTSRR